jgi:hypothetical protein
MEESPSLTNVIVFTNLQLSVCSPQKATFERQITPPLPIRGITAEAIGDLRKIGQRRREL